MTKGDDEADIEALLGAAGPREAPPELVARRVRAAVHAEWAAAVGARRERRRRWATLATAASVAALAVGAWLLRPAATVPAPVVASVVRFDGGVEALAGGDLLSVEPGGELAAGTELRTGRGAGAALAWRDGGSIRVAADTRLALAGDRIVLRQGAVYLDGDAGTGAGVPPVETPLGLVRHLGTRYEVRLDDSLLRVTVRDGRVAVERAGRVETGAAGERLTVAADGQLTREAAPPYGPEWAWLEALAPPFAIEGRSVAELAAWAADETGRRVRYATPAARADAERIVLHGSIEGLAPARALDAALATTHLRVTARDGELVVGLRDDGP